MTTDTFHAFPKLPAEIRLIIWRASLPSADGIIAAFDWRWVGLIPEVNSVPITDGRELSKARRVRIPTPPALFVNRESRDAAQRWAAEEGLEWQHLWASKDGKCAVSSRKGALGPASESEEVQALARDFDASRDYVYLGWERKSDFREWTLQSLEDEMQLAQESDFELDAGGSRYPFPRDWAGGKSGSAAYDAIMQMKHLVVPAFTGYYSTNLMVDILKYRQVEKLYILWGKLPKPIYEQADPGQLPPGNYELDVQPCWRLERIEMTEEGDEDDEVEMYSYVSKAQGRDPELGDDADLYVEKGSLAEWMEELWEQLVEFAKEDVLGSDPAFAKFLEDFEVVPVRLIED